MTVQCAQTPPARPNPQGKGLVTVLNDWSAVQPRLGDVKPPAVLLRDYCFSALVLAARFSFRPRPGMDYFLYSSDSQWFLSLISPVEWGSGAPGTFVANCRLEQDMTWQLEFADIEPGSDAHLRLQAFVDGFAESLAGQASPQAALPYYVTGLPYYQRMLATGLAVSLRHSMQSLDAAALRDLAGSLALPAPTALQTRDVRQPPTQP